MLVGRLKFTWYIFLALMLFETGCSIISKNENVHYPLKIKKVIVDKNIRHSSEYEYGKFRYPQYAYQGLPDDFLIKKSPDLIINPQNIKTIKIQKAIFVSSSKPAYEIIIEFDPVITKIVSDYTKENMHKKIALEIDGKILAIVKILDVISDKVIISSSMHLQEIEKYLRKISGNITVNKE